MNVEEYLDLLSPTDLDWNNFITNIYEVENMSNLTIKDVQNHKHNLESKMALLLNEFSQLTSCRVYDLMLNIIDITNMTDTQPKEKYYVNLEIRI